jgi:hypothetical protein
MQAQKKGLLNKLLFKPVYEQPFFCFPVGSDKRRMFRNHRPVLTRMKVPAAYAMIIHGAAMRI